jgi:hypothetical protein
MKYGTKGFWTHPFEILKLFNDWDGRTPEYRDEIKATVTKIHDGEELTEEKINELERLMNID